MAILRLSACHLKTFSILQYHTTAQPNQTILLPRKARRFYLWTPLWQSPMPSQARQRLPAHRKWQRDRLSKDCGLLMQATAGHMCRAARRQSFIASQSDESSSKRLPLICICDSLGSISKQRFLGHGTICAIGCPYRTIVTTARSLRTNESNPEKFAFASFTFTTVGIASSFPVSTAAIIPKLTNKDKTENNQHLTSFDKTNPPIHPFRKHQAGFDRKALAASRPRPMD